MLQLNTMYEVRSSSNPQVKTGGKLMIKLTGLKSYLGYKDYRIYSITQRSDVQKDFNITNFFLTLGDLQEFLREVDLRIDYSYGRGLIEKAEQELFGLRMKYERHDEFTRQLNALIEINTNGSMDSRDSMFDYVSLDFNMS